MSKKGSSPIRTCIGCRKRGEKEEMIWFTLSPQGVVRVNPKRPHQGRGFYLCPNLGCIQRAKKKNKEVKLLESTEFEAFLKRKEYDKREERDRGEKE